MSTRISIRRLTRTTLTGIAGLACVAATALAAPKYSITLVHGAYGQTGCQIEALADNGMVVGRCDLQGFLWEPLVGGAIAIVDPAHPAAALYPTGVNNLQQVSGSRYDPDGVNPGFVWSVAAGFDYFGTHNRRWDPRAINDAGVVAGHSMSSDDPDFIWKAFRRTEAEGVQPVKPSANRRTTAQDINAAGQMAGTLDWLPRGRTHAVRFEVDQGITRLIPDDNDSSYAAALNDSGAVVGATRTAWLRSQAFIWREATGVQVIDPRTGPHHQSGAQDVNNAEQVVGHLTWVDAGGNTQEAAFYWDPTAGMRPLIDLLDPDDPLRPRIAELIPALVRINHLGQIAINAHDPAGERLMLLLNPMPPH